MKEMSSRVTKEQLNNFINDTSLEVCTELKQKIFRLENYIKILENANDTAQELTKMLREENERLRFENGK